MVPNPVPNNLTGIEVFFSILTFSILNSMLPFLMSPFFRCCRFDVPVFFSMFSYSISPSFPNNFFTENRSRSYLHDLNGLGEGVLMIL
jgi:hypothetical protein